MIQLNGKLFKVSDIIMFTKFAFFKFKFGRGDCSPAALYSLGAHWILIPLLIAKH
jgi:hypothetical protein